MTRVLRPTHVTGRGRWSSRRRWWVWWGELFPVAAICLLIAWANLAVNGMGIEVVAPLVWIGVFSIQKVGARLEYRRGWRQGYETATRVLLERSLGRTPDVIARAAVNGDPTPEPWHVHVPISASLLPKTPGTRAP